MDAKSTRRFVGGVLAAMCMVLAAACQGGDDDAVAETPDGAPAPADASPGTPDAAQLSPDAAEVVPDAATPDAAIELPPDAEVVPDAAPPDAAPPDAMPPTGALRIVHAAPVAGPVDVYVAGTAVPLFTSVAYGQASAYATLPPGSVRLELRDAGAAPTVAPVYTSDPIDVVADASITAVAAGLLGSTSAATQFRVTPLVDGFAAAAPGQARVRVVHGSYSLGTVGVDLGDDGNVEAAALDRFAASDAPGFEVAAGGELPVALIGSDAMHTRQGAFVVPAAMIGEGGDVYAVVTGLSNVRPRDPRGLVVLLVSAHSVTLAVRQNPQIFVLAASADAGGLDAFVDGARVATNVSFGKLGAARVLPTSSGHALVFEPTSAATTPSTTPLASFSTGALVAGEQYLVVLSGLTAPTGADDALALHVYRDELPLSLDGNGRLRVVHAATGVGMIDIGRFSAGAMPAWNDVADFAALLPGAASAPAGTPIVDGTTPVPVNPGVRVAGDPAATPLRFGSGSLMNTDRAYGVFAGAWAPTGTQKPPRYLLVKTGATAWTATVLTPL